MKRRSGFTLIELMVVLVIMVVIALGVAFNLGGFNTKQNLELALNSLTAVVRDTQQRSVTQQDGGTWGLHFYNTDSDRYEVFKGINYDAGTLDKFYVFRHGIGFSNPSTSSTIDVIFNALNGKSVNNQIISLVTSKGEGLVGDVIIGQSGLVTNRIEKDLVDYWHFDEGTSTIAYDASGKNSNGTLTLGPTWQSESGCKAGKCLNFNGTNYVNVPNVESLKPAEEITVLAWIKPSLQGTREFLATKWNGFTVELNTLNQVTAGANIAGSQRMTPVSSALSNNTWTHIAFTYSSRSRTLTTYINGNQEIKSSVLSGLATYSMAVSNNDLRIGSYSTYYWNGLIDEVRIYNRALSPEEILDIYNDLK
ncbi:MAG: LamG domain-containing protein [bacterium]|nr:LamG domain-containing protein [bacterium]